MCFEKHSALFRCKGGLGCSLRESILSLSVLRSSINQGSPFPPQSLSPSTGGCKPTAKAALEASPAHPPLAIVITPS